MSTTMTTTSPSETHSTNDPRFDSGTQKPMSPTFQPRFDIWEGDDEWILYGDLPGVVCDDLVVTFENRQLSVHGKVGRCFDGENALCSEYRVGDFQRSFTVGEAINSEAISAELRDGVLTLHLPKSDRAKPRRIEVSAT
ncbi:Spore protein SP21 [Rubripirellula lacrimiformis]|uniref:Spore protein SP21 n=1 Tax=Rubripirellula lacrimiformis TaxID=1930273 RepID=A0A517N9G8_9BACT|nr:Hsp20/alpha crystallin family protein [Rubripirellula lacrimiformis]QDT03787.1 Spore protein SP21 [Rubripirellula lacrimiformis]